MKNLEDFIQIHRTEFDVHKPGPEVWAGITAGLSTVAAVSPAGKLLGLGFKKLLLVFAVTSATVAGIWAYKSQKPQESSQAPIPQLAVTKEAPLVPDVTENTEAISKTPAPGSTNQNPVDIPDAGTPVSILETAPPPNTEPVTNDAPPVYSTTAPQDSSYTGIKMLKLNCEGYNFIIKSSGSQTTSVRVLKPAKVKSRKTGIESVLKIEQRGSELVFEYEDRDGKAIGKSGRETISTGEIEILIPDQEISQITTVSSNITLSDYATPALGITTVTGEIAASGIKANLEITSVSGNIKLDNIQGKLEITTVSGNVTGEAVSLVEACSIQAVSADINLGFTNSADELRFVLNSLTGNLKINKSSIAMDAKGSVKTGSGKITVKANTTSGNQTYW